MKTMEDLSPKHLSQKHLSDEQFYELVDSQGESDHLRGCAQCRAQVEAVRGSVAGLRQAATKMARSEFRPLLPAKRAGYFGTMRMAWPMALAAAGVLCAASMTMVHRPAANDAVQVQAVSQPAPAEADDALLDGIDQDLSTSVPPSLAPLAVSSGESASSKTKLD